MTSFIDALMSFGLHLMIVTIIVRFIYYPHQRDKQYVFTFFAFSTVVYFVMGLLNNSDISMGVGFGLFAIFSTLRYRTDAIPIREMTYLFILSALPVLNSILLSANVYDEFVLVNVSIVIVLFILEKGWGFQYETRKTITYERIELIRPENWHLLIADLKERTGLPIKRVQIGRLNFLRDTAQITIYYDDHVIDASSLVGFITDHITITDDE